MDYKLRGTKGEAVEDLSRILERATKAIADPYFKLPVQGGDPVFRERVYCYELYHCMRCRWPKQSKFLLNGEVDKSGHSIVKGNWKPDLLVHGPGFMQLNYAIIEVKSIDAKRHELRNDLAKLSAFVREWNYRRGLFLIYGTGQDTHMYERILMEAQQLEQLAPTEIWFHPSVGAPARLEGTLPGKF